MERKTHLEVPAKPEIKHGELEIERKWLVDPNKLPSLDIVDRQEIMQTYLSDPDDDFELRINTVNEKSFATLKSNGDLVRSELDVKISRPSFIEMWDSVNESKIRKTRLVTSDRLDIDFFEDNLDGLVIAEKEFNSVEEANRFSPPEWVYKEVTSQNEFKNRNLLPKKSNKNAPNPEIKDDIYRSLFGWKRLGRPLVIGVTGPTASGKSTYARELATQIGDGVPILRLDDYNRGQQRLEKMYGGRSWRDWDSPLVYDTETAAKDLKTLSRDKQSITKPVFDFTQSESQQFETLKPSSVIVVEGLFALDGNLSPFVDVGVFVDAGITDRVLRRIPRDVERTGWSESDIFSYFMDKAEPANIKYVMSQKEKADFVLYT